MVFLLLKNGILKHADFTSECRKSRFKNVLGEDVPGPLYWATASSGPISSNPFPKYKNLDSRAIECLFIPNYKRKIIS